MTKYEELHECLKSVTMIQHAINLLDWDINIDAPENSKKDIVSLGECLQEQLIKLKASEHYGTLLQDVMKEEKYHNLDIAEQRYIEFLYRGYQKDKLVPSNFKIKYEGCKRDTCVTWKKAKKTNDYELYKPALAKMINMTKEYYSYIVPDGSNIYDVMLNEYERGLTTEVIDNLFNTLKEGIKDLIPDNKDEKIKYETTASKDEKINAIKYVERYMGVNYDSVFLTLGYRGFLCRVAKNDIRISITDSNVSDQIMCTAAHEGGHALYELNINPKLLSYNNDAVEEHYAIHESISRFYENILGRNINFWIPIYEEIKNKLKLNISIEDFINSLNTVSPGLIRTESDELTYCMHIILRYEIERDLFNGKITVDELPNIWNLLMEEYLHVNVTSDKDGLMQDVHWAEGDFGYFPSYLIGTILDGMYAKAIERDLGSIDELLKSGNIKMITNYLKEHLFQYGGAFTIDEVMHNISLDKVSSEPIIEYFNNKYGKKMEKKLTIKQ